MSKDEALTRAQQVIRANNEAIQACKEALEQPVCSKCGKPTQQGECFYGCRKEQPTMTYEQGFDHGWEARLAEEQPAQEPVALIFPENRWYIPSPLDKDEKQIEFNRGFAQGFNDCILHVKLHNQKPLYTHPAPSWQGLTAKEIASIPLNEYTVQTVERMLKEKNT